MSLVDRLKEKRKWNNTFFGIEPPIPLFRMPAPRRGEVATVDFRILQPMKDMEYYYFEFKSHHNLGPEGKDACICPKELYDGECPICERTNLLQEKYAAKGDDVLKRAKEVMREYWRKPKFLTQSLIREQPDTVQIVTLSSALETHVTELMTGKLPRGNVKPAEGKKKDDVELQQVEPIGEVLLSPTKGYWMRITITGGALPNDYYQLAPFKNPSPIAKTKQEIIDILKQRVSLVDMIQEATLPPDQLEKYVKGMTATIRRKVESSPAAPAAAPPAGKAAGKTRGSDMPF
jgi:hypothetical protein